MPRNGSGTFSLSGTFALANQVPNSTTINTYISDIADGLTDSINVDGTKAFEANQPMGGFKLTGLGSGNAAGDSLTLAQAQNSRYNWADAGGTADALTGSYTPAVTAVTDGDLFFVRAGAANATTTPTFTPNSGVVTARTIVKTGNAALVAGDIAADGHELVLRYRASDTKYELLNPKAQAATSATTSAEGIVELATTTEVLTGTDTTRAVTVDALAALWEQGSDIASAGTISIGEGGYFFITGTTTITDIDFATDRAGRKAILVFSGALTLTHNASTLILPGGANITTAGGDVAIVISESSDIVRVVSYQRANGTPVVASTSTDLLGTITTTSGTSQSLGSLTLTSYKSLRLILNGVSGDGALTLALGNSSSDDVAVTVDTVSAAGVLTGIITIDLGTGIATSVYGNANPNGVGAVYVASTAFTTSSTTITAISAGGDNFDAGSIICYGVR